MRALLSLFDHRPTAAEPLALFVGDGLHRLLVWLRIEHPHRPDWGRRAAFGAVLAWVPLFAACLWAGNFVVVVSDADAGLVNQTLSGELKFYFPRESFMLDLAAYAQFVGFIPLAFLAEGFIGRKIQMALLRLRPLTHEKTLRTIARRADRLARTGWSDIVILVCAGIGVWTWAGPELHNGIESWHTHVVSLDPLEENFTLAGYWAAWFSLPLFTYVWMRWVWKIGVWTYFLWRVSRLRLRLRAAHPDRTGGLGCLSDVQTSFASILFGTGLLFAGWAIHKFVFEQTPIRSTDVWLPISLYIILAPGTFIGPLFLFTKKLASVKRDGQVRYGDMAVRLAGRFEQRWLRTERPEPEQLLDSPQASTYADFTTAYQVVDDMRVVPFDRRSFIELFTASASPFAPLVFFLQIPDKVKSALDLIGG